MNMRRIKTISLFAFFQSCAITPTATQWWSPRAGSGAASSSTSSSGTTAVTPGSSSRLGWKLLLFCYGIRNSYPISSQGEGADDDLGSSSSKQQKTVDKFRVLLLSAEPSSSSSSEQLGKKDILAVLHQGRPDPMDADAHSHSLPHHQRRQQRGGGEPLASAAGYEYDGGFEDSPAYRRSYSGIRREGGGKKKRCGCYFVLPRWFFLFNNYCFSLKSPDRTGSFAWPALSASWRSSCPPRETWSSRSSRGRPRRARTETRFDKARAHFGQPEPCLFVC